MRLKFLFQNISFHSDFNFSRIFKSRCLQLICYSSLPQTSSKVTCRYSEMHTPSKSKFHFTLDRGLLVGFEGVDRAGKSTQTELLLRWIRENRIVSSESNSSAQTGPYAELIKFPERSTPVGKIIDSYLKKDVTVPDETIHLLYSANRWEYNSWIRNNLQNCCSIILDRYAYSGVAYTAAKRVPGRNLQWCMQPDAGLPRPDILFYLRVPQDDNANREGFGAERYETLAFQREVALTYENLRKRCTSQPFEWVDLEVPPEMGVDAVHERIVAHVVRFLRSRAEPDSDRDRDCPLGDRQTETGPGTTAPADSNKSFAVSLGPLCELW